MKLKRTVFEKRRAYTIEALKVDGEPVKVAIVRTPDGEARLSVGDTLFAKAFLKLFEGILNYVDWHGSDILTLDRLPVKKLKLVRLIHPPGRAYRVESVNDGKVKSQLIVVPQGDILFEVGDIIPIRDFIRELTEIIGHVEWTGQDTVAIDKL